MENSDPIAEVAEAAAHLKRVTDEAESAVAHARTRRDRAIREASRAVRQVDLVRASGLTRETIRRIVNGRL